MRRGKYGDEIQEIIKSNGLEAIEYELYIIDLELLENNIEENILKG